MSVAWDTTAANGREGFTLYFKRISQLVEILLEAHKHIANLGRSSQVQDGV